VVGGRGGGRLESGAHGRGGETDAGAMGESMVPGRARRVGKWADRVSGGSGRRGSEPHRKTSH
jgi:hypothetical protein